MNDWNGKHYYSLDSYLKRRFGKKVYKVSLTAKVTCPNRDGTLGTSGCIFCSAGGSGDFASSSCLSISEQIHQGITQLNDKVICDQYIAYFQAFTNTYGDIHYLRSVFLEAISHPRILALSIGTRPDCLPPDILDLLEELNQIKPIFIELGLQTIHDSTAQLIRRGYETSVFYEAVDQLHQRGIDTVVHVILGLPYETEEMMLSTIEALNPLPIQGIKLHMLHVLKDTPLGNLYQQSPFPTFTLESYVDLLATLLPRIRKDMVIHRLTGDGPKQLLLAPKWSGNKRKVLNTIEHEFRLRDIWQGSAFDWK